MTQFQSGKSGNANGSNRTRRIKSKISQLLEQSLPTIEQELKTATPEVRRGFFLDLANIALPSKTKNQND